MKASKFFAASLVALTVLVTGCATTHQARSMNVSPFLGSTVSLLKPGKDDQALMVYIKPEVDWTKYQKVIIEPVTYWVDKDHSDGISEQERKALINYTYAKLNNEMGKSLTITDIAGPDTLRMSAALFKGEKTYPVLASVATLVPMALAVNIMKTAVTGKSSFVGELSGEMKVTDSVSGDIVAAGADRRVGGMAWKAKESRIEVLESASDHWAQMIAYRMCKLQLRSECKKPTE